MKALRTLAFFLVIAVLAGCSSPMIRVSDNLKSNTLIMDVRGVQGWQINQVITYGDYITSKVKRSWDSGYSYDFFVRFEAAKNKLSFLQVMPGGAAEVSAVGKIENTEIDLLNGYLSYPLHYKNYFTGLIVPRYKDNSWQFIIHNPSGAPINDLFDKDLSCGYAKDDKGNEIKIMAVRELKDQVNLIKFEHYGFEFYYNDVSIATVETINNCRVWIKNDLPEDIKLIVASMSKSLLLRHSLEDHIEDY